jgi:sugar phosphate isomerase/epimerase
MEFGVCGNPELVPHIPRPGFAFMESTVAALLKPREDESAFHAALAAFRAAGMPCPALNCFLPGDLKVTGPAADPAALEAYVTVALRRAEEAGVQTIVFGSGGARAVPEGFDRGRAREQIVAFCRMLGPIAARHGVTIVVEPLYKKACNILNTVGESAALVREVNHPAIRLLADSFHVLWDGDCLEDIVAHGDLLRHVHVATAPGRRAPGTDECDLGPFFRALARAGYNWRVSIEANLPEPDKDLVLSLAAMKNLHAAGQP